MRGCQIQGDNCYLYESIMCAKTKTAENLKQASSRTHLSLLERTKSNEVYLNVYLTSRFHFQCACADSDFSVYVHYVCMYATVVCV